MKIVYALFFLCLFGYTNITAQDVELKLDSFYQARWPSLLSGVLEPNLNIDALDYDTLDRVIQSRSFSENPNSTSPNITLDDFYYEGDSIIRIWQAYDTPNDLWTLYLRSTTYPIDAFNEVKISENYTDGEWIVSNKTETTYNTNGDIVDLKSYTWQDGIYNQTGGQITTYNDDFFILTSSTYFVNNESINVITRFREWIYEGDNIQMQFKDSKLQNDVLTLENQTDYIYENDLIFQKIASLYIAQDTFQGLEDFMHLDVGVYEVYKSNRNPGQDWVLSSKSLFYETPKDIGNLVDSIFLYQYDAALDSFDLFSKQYYDYDVYAPGKALFLKSIERYVEDTDTWAIVHDQAEYYHFMEQPSALEETMSKATMFNIFPNPVGDQLKIQTEIANDVRQVRIFSISGDLLRQYEGFQEAIDVSGFSQGTYFVQMGVGSKLQTYPFVKM